jgi:hypothetical protein
MCSGKEGEGGEEGAEEWNPWKSSYSKAIPAVDVCFIGSK